MSEKGSIELYLYGRTSMDHSILPQHVEGRFWFYHHDNNVKTALFEIDAEHGEWYIVQNEQCHMEGVTQRRIRVRQGDSFHMHAFGEQMLLMVSSYERHIHQFQCVQAIKKDIWIGRDETCDIIVNHDAVSSRHAHLILENEEWHLKDNHSTNGVYVNGVRTKECILRVKDNVRILDLCILIGVHCLYLNQADIQIQNDIIRPYIPPQTHVKDKEVFHPFDSIPMDFNVFEKKEFMVDMPPQAIVKKEQPFILVAGPAITMGISSISMGLFSMLQLWLGKSDLLQSMPSLVMSLSMAAGTILWPLLSRRYEKKEICRKNELRIQTYTAYLKELQQAVEQEMEAYGIWMRRNFLDSARVLAYLDMHKRAVLTQEHPAWFHLVLGYGTVSYKPVFDATRVGFTIHKDELQKLREALLDMDFRIEDAAITIDMNNIHVISISGHKKEDFLLDLILQCALCYRSVDIVIVAAMPAEVAYRNGIAWLPHLYPMDHTFRTLLCDEHDIYQIHKMLEDEIRPVFFFSCYPLSHETLQHLRQYEQLTCIYLSDKADVLCSSQEAFIMLYESYGTCAMSNQQVSFHVAIQQAKQRREAAQNIAMHHVSVTRSSMNSGLLHFLDMYACASTKQLNIWERWQKHDATVSLAVKIGMSENGPLILDAHEKGHGPHGLFAGMTGSGKSECLLTYILSLCVTYSCDDVSFLLIDYKGGTMASVCEQLPHTSGIITNLQEDMLQRSFLSLQSELTRRQELFSETAKLYDIGNMNIDRYNRLCREHETLKKLPHLFIIADEFAELKMQQPAFMEQLKQSARIGRSLGIHLLLATQKPYGVIDDQIWSNAGFHLCMKVQSTQDSQDMLKRDDAAYLKRAGACCYQVGMNEVYETGVIAWSQGPYIEKEEYRIAPYDEICILRPDASPFMSKHIAAPSCTSSITQMEAVIQAVRETAKRHGKTANLLWKHALPALIAQKDHVDAFLYIDDMKHQRQFPLALSHMLYAHMVLYGDEYKSKTMYFKTMVYLMVHKMDDKKLLYIFDFAHHELDCFAGCACVEAVLHETDQDKIHCLFQQLKEEVQQRKQKKADLPVYIILHNYELFHELYGELDEEVIRLLREGEELQIYVILSASKSDTISYRLTQYIHEVIAFHLYEAMDYQRLFQVSWCPIPATHTGSGVMLFHEEPVLFQVLHVNDEDIGLLPGRQMWQDAYRIRTLPSKITHALDEAALYVGMDMIRRCDVILSVWQCHMNYFCAAYRLADNVLTLMIQQVLLQYEEAYIITPDTIYQHSGIISQNAFYSVLRKNTPLILFWYQPYEYHDSRLQEYLIRDLMDDGHVHYIMFTMKEQGQYLSFPWFQEGLHEARILWMGKGMDEYRYVFKNDAVPHHELKKNQAYLLEDEECIQIQLWEEERCG